MRRARAQADARASGFTLLELLIALGIAGLLASLALPSYRSVMQRTLRQDARLALLRIQGQQERHFIEHLRYADQLAAPATAGGLGLAATSDSGGYALSLQADPAGLGYIAFARAQGRQAGDRDCALLTLDQSGQRGSEGADGQRRVPDRGHCWK